MIDKHLATRPVTISSLCACLFVHEMAMAEETEPSPKDLEAAREFMTQLPPSCRQSRMSRALDGSIVILLSCEKRDDRLVGMIRIKDGVIADMR